MPGTFNIDDDAVNRMLADAKKKLEADANPKLQNAIRTVRDRYAGEDADVVYEQLVIEITEQIGIAFTPNEPQLREFAEAIVKGELTG